MKCVIFSILLASALAQEVTLPNVSPVSLPEPQVPLEALTKVLDQLVAALGLSSIKPEGVTFPSVDGVTLPSLDGVTVPGRAKRDILPGATDLPVTGLPTGVPSTNALTELLQKIVAALSLDGVTLPSADGITVPSVDGVTLPSRSKRQVNGVTVPSTPLDELVQQLKDLLEKIQGGAVTLPALDGVTVPSVDGVTVPSRSKRQVESVTGLPTVPSTNVLTELIEKIKSLLSLDGVTLPSIDGVTVPSVDGVPSRSKRQVDEVTVPSTDGIEGLFQQLKELLEKLQGGAGVTGLPISRATRLPVTLPVNV